MIKYISLAEIEVGKGWSSQAMDHAACAMVGSSLLSTRPPTQPVAIVLTYYGGFKSKAATVVFVTGQIKTDELS